MRREPLIFLASSQEGAFLFQEVMDIRKLVGLSALLLLLLGLSLILWTSKSTWARNSEQTLACGCTADDASPEDYARIIQKALASKKTKEGNL